MELVAPAGNLPALDAALDGGADSIYVGFRDQTNARAFPGLNFSDGELAEGIRRAHARGRRVFIALNSHAEPARLPDWQRAVDRAAALGADAIIVADMAVLDYACRVHPDLPRHLSVQGSATTAAALAYLHGRFGISRAVLPRVLSIEQVERLAGRSPVPLETFAFGSLCIMVEGRCQLSGYYTGASPNRHGVCSPARFVRWEELPDGGRAVRLNGVLVDRFGANEPAAYPTVCKGRYDVGGHVFHALEEPTSLNTIALLPRLSAAGVVALKIEGRQRGAAYVRAVVSTWRQALDSFRRQGDGWVPSRDAVAELAKQAEGRQTTLGAYHRSWQ